MLHSWIFKIYTFPILENKNKNQILNFWKKYKIFIHSFGSEKSVKIVCRNPRNENDCRVRFCDGNWYKLFAFRRFLQRNRKESRCADVWKPYL